MAVLQEGRQTVGDLSRLRDFVVELGALIDRVDEEQIILEEGAALLGRLISSDNWLPDAYAQADRQYYRQYLLHCDSRERFSIVSFVWGPGQATPIHNHRVWGLVGVLRGAEISEGFDITQDGLSSRSAHRLDAGDVETISPSRGDIHRVSNAFGDRVSVSIHIYGANIGAVERQTFGEDGRPKPFISGYANATLPNIWL